MQDIRTLSTEELKTWILEQQEKPFRAKQISEWLWKKNVASFSEMKNIPSDLISLLEQHFSLNKISIEDRLLSSDKSLKYKIKLFDGQYIEMVLIPSKSRTTVCVSSQVGCALGCKFCATGAIKFKRNLFAHEMYEQVFVANEESKQIFGHPLSNIVWMGMGEPLLNYTNFISAVNKVMSPDGLAMSKYRITVSTCGICDGIKQLADDQINIQLAVSLHSANNTVRSTIMPINKTSSLSELSDALFYYYNQTKNRISIEYLLLRDITDRIEHIQQLASFCRRFPVKINLIEYNPHPYAPYQKSLPEQVEKIMDFLTSKNMVVNLRKSKGKDIQAACGQLAAQKNE